MKKLLIFCYSILLLTYALPPVSRVCGRCAGFLSERERTVGLLGKDEPLAMADYLTGVLAAEMPASFGEEALKAQAVAARSYTLYCLAHGKHAGKLCANAACCQAYLDAAQRRERWGEDFPKYERRVRDAVRATAGEILRYEGSPVQAVFHASSYLCTESSAEVWRGVPYLVSVSSPESPETVPGLISYAELTAEELKNAVENTHPEANFPEDAESWLEGTERDASGRVKKIKIAGAELTGKEVRSLFLLRSTAFELSYGEGKFLFTVSGFGHGVGMSQQGANVMAQQGADYTAILAHYYPSTTLCRS